MPISYNKDSNDIEYNDFLKELLSSNCRKNNKIGKYTFNKGSRYEFNKYLYIT